MYARILWPWQTSLWGTIKTALEAKISTVYDLDSRLAAISGPKIRTTRMSEVLLEGVASPDVNILCFIQHLVLIAPKTVEDVYMLVRGKPGKVVLDRLQIACITACIWFNLFDYKYVSEKTIDETFTLDTFPVITMAEVIKQRNTHAVRGMFDYFARVYEELGSPTIINGESIVATAAHTWPGIVIFARGVDTQTRLTDAPLVAEILTGRMDPNTPMRVHSSYSFVHGRTFLMENSRTNLDALGSPETLVAALFTEELCPGEFLCVFGAERMFVWDGQGTTAQFGGTTATTGGSMHKTADIFVAASSDRTPRGQFIDTFNDDLLAAHSALGCVDISDNRVESEHWCHGMGGSNIYVKFIQLLLAASSRGKCLVYYTRNISDFDAFMDWITANNVTVAGLLQLYRKLLVEIKNNNEYIRLNNIDVFDRIMSI